MATEMSTACWSIGLNVAQPLGNKDGHKDEHSLLVKVYV